MDQGWNGTFIAEAERPGFIKKLHCDYGTSGGLWVYHCGRWDRLSYFLPYPEAIGCRDPSPLRGRRARLHVLPGTGDQPRRGS